MATTVKITELPIATTVDESAVFVVNDTTTNTTKQISKEDLFTQLELDIENYLTDGVRSVVPNLNDTYDLGSSVKKWRDVYVSGDIVAASFTGDGSGLTNLPISAVGGSAVLSVTPSSLPSNHSVLFTLTNSGTDSVNTDPGLLYNPSTNTLTSGSFVGSAANMSNRVDSNGIKSLLSTGVNTILPAADSAYDLGSPTKKWKDLYLSGNTIYLGNTTISTNGSNLIFDGNRIPDSDQVVSLVNANAVVVEGGSFNEVEITTLYVRDSNSSSVTGLFSDQLTNGSLDFFHNNRHQASILSSGFSLYLDPTLVGGTIVDTVYVKSGEPEIVWKSNAVRGGSSDVAATFGWESTIGGGFQTVGQISYNQATVTYGGTSDYRLKENIVPLDSALDRLSQLPVHRFNFISMPTQTYDGFLSHEVQAVVPEAVVGEKDAVDSDGNIIPQMLDQGKLIPLLVASIQELKTRVEQLEAQLAG